MLLPITSDCSAFLFDAVQQKWLLFSSPTAIYTTNKREEIESLLETIEKEVTEEKLYAVGFLSYEAAAAFDPAMLPVMPQVSSSSFPLLWFAIYQQPQIVSPSVLTCYPETIELCWQPSITEQQYYQALKKIKSYIQSGYSYQVNYTFHLESVLDNVLKNVPQSLFSWRLFSQIIHNQAKCYGAFLQSKEWIVASASPELFFQLHKDRLYSRPMKGTARRGLSFLDDRQKREELQNSVKERAENIMIVDMVRNDLSKIGKDVSVKSGDLFRLECYPTLWQMTSEVTCRSDAGLVDIFKALFPPASVTGAPKIETMKIIAQLEGRPRQIYTGTIGFLAPGRRAQFNVAIRTLLIERQKKKVSYGIGSGITWDSVIESEWAECRSKAQIIRQVSPQFSLLETILWTVWEDYFLLEYHLQRLRESAIYFGYPLDEKKIKLTLAQLSKQFRADTCKVRLKVRLLVDREGNIDCQYSPWQQPKPSLQLCLGNAPIDSTDPFLYHKTTWRKTYEEARRACPQYDDLLLWNSRGELTEASIANVVVEQEGRLYTPPLSCGLLGGTYRAALLDRGEIEEKVIPIEDLQKCSRIYLINSVYKWLPAKINL